MIFYLNLIWIVIAVSLDGFGVGITYGMRRIKIPFSALLVIIICSGTIVITSMTIGHLLRMVISPAVTSMIGSFIFISLGLFVLYTALRANQLKKKQASNSQNSFDHFKKVFSEPEQADKDQSGTISFKEALILGTALALDAFGAGLGASMLGYSPILTSILIASMSGLFVFCGLRLGFIFAAHPKLSRLTFLPPIILISIGLYNLF